MPPSAPTSSTPSRPRVAKGYGTTPPAAASPGANAMPTIVDDFLTPGALATLQQHIQRRRGGRDVYGNLQDHPFLASVQRAAEVHFPAVTGLQQQQALLRFEGNTGLLHHDLNHRPDRVLSLLLYIDEPKLGGELVFPLLDTDGQPRAGPISHACQRLTSAGQLYSEDPALEAYILDHRSEFFTVPARTNTAVLFPSDDPLMWHFACPVEAGERSCVVIFYRHP